MNFDKTAMGHGHPFVNLQDVFGKNKVSNNNLGLAFSTEKQRKEYSLNTGDVLFINLEEPHIALYVGNNRILHALKKYGVRLDRYNEKWKKLTKSIWRLKRETP